MQRIFERQVKMRESNMELLRILAMVLVMVVHANFRALSAPTFSEFSLMPSSTFLRLLTESISIV